MAVHFDTADEFTAFDIENLYVGRQRNLSRSSQCALSIAEKYVDRFDVSSSRVVYCLFAIVRLF